MFTADADAVIGAALEAESLGFDGAFAFDHLHPIGGPPDRPALECFTTLAAVAALTSRIAIATLVTRVALRPAGMLARLAAGLDEASDGRAILGLGTGDRQSEDEHRRFGFTIEAPAERTERLLETAQAIRALLGGLSYRGGTLVPPVVGPLRPPPHRPGGPPLWIGGVSSRVIEVAALAADAWNGWGLDIEAFGTKVRLLDELCESLADAGAGTPHVSPVEATWGGIVLLGENAAEARRLAADREQRGTSPASFAGPPDGVAEHLMALRDAGASWIVLLLAGPRDRRALFADAVLPLVRR
jgi:alkanesulfonate monooxygenase SsuD/methylene tetrahydromethanopterin reductase-like flavin-dependent oxidoreductase (luciferase family)